MKIKLKQSLISESFQWAQELLPILKQFEDDGVTYYKVIASTADIKNRNHRIYTSDELSRAASSLSERPLNINHEPKRTLSFPENQVIAARFESGHVECIIQVADQKVNGMIQSGEISTVSIEGIYLDGSKNTHETEYPSSLHFQALALLTKDDTPGDPNAQILKESLDSGKQKHNAFAIYGEIMEHIVTKLEADMSTANVDDLPDDAFAYVSPGGKKDDQGKTTPRSNRHLPFKGPDGKPDPAHVRNALSRLSQTDISSDAKAVAGNKLQSAAKELGIQTTNDRFFEGLKAVLNLYERGLISKSLYQQHLREQGLMNAENDARADPGRSETGRFSGAGSLQNFSGSTTEPENENPKDQSTQQNVSVDRNVQSAKVEDPKAAESEQDFTVKKVKVDFTGVGNPDSTVKPKMDYPESVNPLSITNDSKQENHIMLTEVFQSSSLMNALTAALNDSGMQVTRLGVSESKTKKEHK
ncbi:MAG: hypothetical protein ACYC9R_12925 [Nitrosotalea sp.]